ncbi:MAG TPA: isoprenylcysteine carboxylmethyltransferase family protein [Alphaproteobacteria bacterium]|jgi:protein-S-isoprenylcysteine O-methyltransferase Ste14|nr:isoprenylcysteine carboxylmethyltransferase family protein [Alphaproteobacteria bacterium]
MNVTNPRPQLLKARRRHTWIAALPLVFFLLVTDSSWRALSALNELYQWLGYFALLLCVLGRAWCSAYIGGRKNYELITLGPYSVVRNPLYVFSFIGVAGIGLASGTVTFLVALAVLFAAYYRIVVKREEAFLASGFGQAFAGYAARVPRWWPDFSLWRDAPEIAVRPHFLLITLRDSSVFLLAFPLLELIEWGHEAGLLPVLLRVP